MPNEAKKDSRDRSKPGAPEGAIPAQDQRRFRSQPRYGGNGAGDDARRTVDDETSGDAPMDPPDEEFIKSK